MSRRLLFAALALLASGCLATPTPVPSTPGPLACLDPCKVLLDDSTGQAWEPHVAIDPDDGRHVAVASRTVGAGETPGSFSAWFNVHATTDGGGNWTMTPLRYTKPLGEGGAEDPNVVGDPVLTFLPDGSLLATGATLQYIGLNAGVLARVTLYSVRSPDGGFTFEEPVVVARSEGVVAVAYAPPPLKPVEAPVLMRLPDKPWIAAAPDGTVVLAWADIVAFHPDAPSAYRTDLRYVVSRDGGRTWSPSQVAASGASLEGPSIALTERSWSIAYVDLTAREARIAVSPDEGRTWNDFAVAPNLWMPSLAVSRDGLDRLYLAGSLPAPGSAGEAADDAVQSPFLAWSDDGGATWSTPLTLDEPRPGRVLPSVAIDGVGTVYVTYMHAEPEDGSQPVSYRAVALQGDGSRSAAVLDPVIPAPASSLGDYLGLAAGPRGAYATWVTTADGQQFDLAGAALTA